MEVREDAKVGAEVGVITARDPDVKNKPVRYNKRSNTNFPKRKMHHTVENGRMHIRLKATCCIRKKVMANFYSRVACKLLHSEMKVTWVSDGFYYHKP